MPGTTAVPCTISANTSMSSTATFKQGSTPVLLTMPSGWNPACLLTIQITVDGVNFFDITNPDGSPINTVVTPGASALLLQHLIGWATAARVRSGTFQSPVPQLQDRVFNFITSP